MSLPQCNAVWDSWELCVFRFLSSHSYHSNIFNTWEYSYSFECSLRYDSSFSPSVCLPLHAFRTFSVWKIYEIFLIYLYMFECVRVYFNIQFTPDEENQAERTLNGCYRVVHATAQCKSNEYSILLKFYASVNVLFSWRWCASIQPPRSTTSFPCSSTIVCVTNVIWKNF